MSKKKNFKTTLDFLIDGDTENQVKQINLEKPSSEEKRVTFIIKNSHFEKLKAISYIERKLLKETFDEAITDYITKYEKSNGEAKRPIK